VTALGLALLVVGAVAAVAEAHYPAHGIVGGIGVAVMAVRRVGDQRAWRRRAGRVTGRRSAGRSGSRSPDADCEAGAPLSGASP
jgi:hypothetical protein